jgi:hypothetical protein
MPMNFVMLQLDSVPIAVRAALCEYNANFKIRWDGLLSARQEAMAIRNWRRVEEIDSEISQMMVVNRGEVGQRNIVGKIVGGPNGYAIVSEDFLCGLP